MIQGKYIKIHVYQNKYFDNIVAFVLEHFDKSENKDSVIVISDFILNNVEYYRSLYPNSKIVIYNWEQMVGNNTYFNLYQAMQNMKGADEIWDYDYLNKEYLEFYGIKVDKVIPFKYTENLSYIQNNDTPAIDVLLFGYMNNIRLEKLKHITNELYHDYSFMSISGFDRESQAKYIADSKIILNIHGMKPYCRQEQERIAFCLINEKCVLSETSQQNYFSPLIVESQLQDISKTIKHLLKNDLWREVASQGKKRFREGNYNLVNNEI